MIKSLEIENIQSHENTKLDFVNGINVIIGSSNQGKSAILRALYWLRNNRPLGIDNLASHWIVNDKGYLNGEMSVKVVNDNGEVERRRTKDENQYIVDGKVLNVVKTDVPEQVSKILKLSDTNVQKQLDSPFLLSQTSGEVAKYFNQMVNLDVIDKVLTNAETKRRKLKSIVENSSDEIDRLANKVEEFNWVDDTLADVEKYNNLNIDFERVKDSINFMCDAFHSYNDLSKWVEWVEEFVGNRKFIVNEIDSILLRLGEIDKETEEIDKEIESFESIEIYDFSSQNKNISKINFIKNEIDSMSIFELKRLIDEYEEQVLYIKRCNKSIDDYRAMLPKVCPLCGSLLEDGKCVSC